MISSPSHEQGFSAIPVAIAITIAVLVSGLGSWILLSSGGNLMPVLALLAGLTILFLSVYRVDWAFFMFFGMVLLFDQFIVVPFEDPITNSVRYFDNIKQLPFIPSISVGVMNPLEIQLLLMILGLLIALSVHPTVTVQQVPYWGFAVLLALAIALSIGRGLSSGGDFLPSLWEVRALFYFLLLTFLVPQVIRTRTQIATVIAIMIAVMAVKAFQGALSFARLGFSFGNYDCLTNHEDPVFIADLTLLLLALIILRVKCGQRTALLLLLPLYGLGFYAGQRRAAYAGLIVCVGVLALLLKAGERGRFWRVALPILLCAVTYGAVFWNNTGRLGAPVQLIKSGFSESKEGSGERYTSNLYREIERYDLGATIQGAPVLGIGFGKKYLQPLPLVPIPFPLRDWIPHDEILWLAVKMGAVGFLIFCLCINGFLFEAASLSRSLRDPFLHAVCIMITAAIVNQIVVSYYDLQLTYYRNMVVLGTFCGFLPTIKAWADVDEGA